MSDHETNGAWWLSKSDARWSQAELRQLKDDVPDLDEYWRLYALYEDPFEFVPGLASKHAIDRLLVLDYEQPAKWYESNPVVTRSSSYVPLSAMAAIGRMALMFGVAVIFDQGRLTLIGRAEIVDLLHDVIQPIAKRCRSVQSTLPRRPGLNRRKQVEAWWSVFDEEAEFVLAYFQEQLEFMPLARISDGLVKRVAISKVQHAVYQVSLSFRDWAPPPGSPEVVLKPIDDGGRLLGGVVWKMSAYETEASLRALGLPTAPNQRR